MQTVVLVYGLTVLIFFAVVFKTIAKTVFAAPPHGVVEIAVYFFVAAALIIIAAVGAPLWPIWAWLLLRKMPLTAESSEELIAR